MIKRAASFVLVFAILLGLGSALPLSAQSGASKQERKVESVKREVGKRNLDRKKVNVKLYSGTSYKGSVTEADDVKFVIVDKTGSSHSVSYADVRSIGGTGLSTGAKIAIGAAIGAGAVLGVLVALIASDENR